MTALIHFLEWTAWPMTTPAVYGWFHLLFVFAGIPAAGALAWLLRTGSIQRFNRIMAVTGFILLVGEVYKQLMYYFILNQQRYDWWLFPFQLCSLPMYLCPLLSLIHNPNRHRRLCTFLLDFNMMGAVATFIDPSGILHPYWTLSLHGMLWHLLLIFTGFLIIFSRRSDLSWQGFYRTLPLFALFCAAAELFNMMIHPHGTSNLFYISPWEMSTQLLFSDIDRILGRPVGIVLYILAMIAGAALIHHLARLLSARPYHAPKA